LVTPFAPVKARFQSHPQNIQDHDTRDADLTKTPNFPKSGNLVSGCIWSSSHQQTTAQVAKPKAELPKTGDLKTRLHMISVFQICKNREKNKENKHGFGSNPWYPKIIG
jgi:hypothetical protein